MPSRRNADLLCFDEKSRAKSADAGNNWSHTSFVLRTQYDSAFFFVRKTSTERGNDCFSFAFIYFRFIANR